MNNYPGSLYNTGFIHHTANALRLKQGLDSQQITNSCVQYLLQPQKVSQYAVRNNPPHNSNTNAKSYPTLSATTSSATCDPYNMYPVDLAQVNYGPGTPDANCPCLRYLNLH
jgi:hypothetical protein